MKKLWLILLAVTLCLTLGYGKALAQPVQDAPGGIGDILLYSLYDVRDTANRGDNWQNYVVIENTSGQWTAAHLRFRAWRKSIEVYDHVILLSPYDVFWFTIKRATVAGITAEAYPVGGQAYVAGDVILASSDTETLQNSGLINPPSTNWSTMFQDYLLTDCGYTDAYLGALADPSTLHLEMQAGHLEVIGLWQLSSTWDAVNLVWQDEPLAAHNLATVVNDIYPDTFINVYDVLDALFWDTPAAVPDWPARGAFSQDGTGVVTIEPISPAPGAERPLASIQRWGIDCANVLAGAIGMNDFNNGRFEVTNAVALADFRTLNRVDPVGPGLEVPIVAKYVLTGLGLHRDDYDYGAIVFDTDLMGWVANINPQPYLNENWATTVGPGLRDGDDFVWDIGNPLLILVPPWPHQFVGINHILNDAWSLDDVEAVLEKNEIWYHYYNMAGAPAFTTDFVMDFFTKHYHYFFADFPLWNVTAPYATPVLYETAVTNYRDQDAEGTPPMFDTLPLNGSIATWFQAIYQNGQVMADAFVFNMEQDTPGGIPPGPPPGSPWHPVHADPVTIPHEVNMIRVGAAAGTGINSANGILNTVYESGHFTIQGAALQTGQRVFAGHPLYNVQPYLIPSVGIMIFELEYGAGLVRSAAAPWHYTIP